MSPRAADHGGALRTFFLRLGTVLQQLRPKCRAAVELRFTHDLSYREIAMHLGVSPQMAKKYVAQGLSHCRRRMAQLG